MQNAVVLGISVGESFAEFSLLEGAKRFAQKRIYLSREPLKSSLQQFAAEHADKKISRAFVTLRIPKRLLDFHFGEAVAHVTTEGLENWLSLTKTAKQLTRADLLFSVGERVLANGQIEKAISLEELEKISAKLKEQKCQKVCLHFLHADKNAKNLQAAQTYFTQNDFEVFTPAMDEVGSEIERWNKNALRATVASVFKERRSEIFQALNEIVLSENIFFLDSAGKVHNAETAPDIESFFCVSTALGLTWGQKQKADVLYLGVEGFWLISNSQWNETWESAWGPVQMKHLHTQSLEVQPTLGVHLNVFNHFDFTTQQEGWEPGPMFLGRGQKLTLLDLWAENPKITQLPGLTDRLAAAGVQRFKNSLFALSKITRTKNNDLVKITEDLQNLSLQRLAMETYLHRQSEKLIVTGPLAAMFATAFKKDPHTVVDGNEFTESEATALWGQQSLLEKA